MAALSKLGRLARLGGWIALSTGAMVAAALSAACSSTPRVGTPKDAAMEVPRDDVSRLVLPDAAARPDAGSGEAESPVDADRTDLWNVICE